MKQLILPVIALLFLSAAGTHSSLYRDDGKLMADTSFTIGPLRLTKWKKLESDSVLKYLRMNTRYPMIEKEAGVQRKFVVSIMVNDSAKFSEIRPVNDSVDKWCKGMWMETKRVISQFPGVFLNDLKPPKNRTYEYYLPIWFVICPKDSAPPANGYLQIITTPSPPLDVHEDGNVIQD